MMPTLLIIEDEKTLSEYLSKALERAGFAVFIAADAESGLKVAQERKPAIILLDILLPGGSGEDLLKTLKSSEATKNIAVVVLTNFSDPELKERCMNLGCADFLLKADYRLDQIVAKVKELSAKILEK